MFYPQMCESLFEKIRLYICLEGGKLTPKALCCIVQTLLHKAQNVLFFSAVKVGTLSQRSLWWLTHSTGTGHSSVPEVFMNRIR